MFHIIFNPIAGKGKSEQYRKIIEGRLNALAVKHCFHVTHSRRHAVEIVRSLTHARQDAPLDIVAMGGDGTLNEVLNGLSDPANTRLGLIPCGSGNDFAAAAGIPQSPEGALNVLLKGEAKYTDYMECSGIRGINIIGTGIDVDILRRYANMKHLTGSVGYMLSLILTVLTFKFYKFSEDIKGKRLPHSALIACAGNGQRLGGGIPICPQASIDDGLLDIVIVDNLKKHAIPGAFISLLRRRILDQPYTVFRRADRMRIVSEEPLPVQIDGEIYDNLPFDVRVISRQLRMYRP